MFRVLGAPSVEIVFRGVGGLVPLDRNHRMLLSTYENHCSHMYDTAKYLSDRLINMLNNSLVSPKINKINKKHTLIVLFDV